MELNALLAAIGNTALTAKERLDALREIAKDLDKIERTEPGIFVNNHIHTCYSFSPYTPTSAVFYAWKAGLRTAGIMDHDSVGGIKEFIEAGEIMNMPITCGFECRVNVKGTALEGKKINNPDQKSCAYLAMQFAQRHADMPSCGMMSTYRAPLRIFAIVSLRTTSHTGEVWQSCPARRRFLEGSSVEHVPSLRSWKYSGFVAANRWGILNLLSPWQLGTRLQFSLRRSW